MLKDKKQNAAEVIKRLYVGILLLIFGGIVLHAPISVGLGAIFPDYDLLIKSWKEVLMSVAGILAVYLMFKNAKFSILNDLVIRLIGVYAFLHVFSLIYFYQGFNAVAAGLLIDLRYVLFFVLVYVALKLYPDYRKFFIKVGIAGALIVLVFALLQVFILPADILKYIGYSSSSISPYLTVDQNHDFIRINSTLRGPNPLGAYIVIVLSLLVAAICRRKLDVKKKRLLFLITLVSVGGAVSLWASYSRSALAAAFMAVGIVVVGYRKLSTKMWITFSIIALILMGGVFALRNTSFVSNVLLHENPTNIDNISSNKGHIDSLSDGTNRFLAQPFGVGVGSTGSASLYSKNPLIIENQYLAIAHEVGWLGLGLFILIFSLILKRLWALRKDWLALGVFASGVGLLLIGLLLPVWTDDTVSIIWWGFAAVALFPNKELKKS